MIPDPSPKALGDTRLVHCTNLLITKFPLAQVRTQSHNIIRSKHTQDLKLCHIATHCFALDNKDNSVQLTIFGPTVWNPFQTLAFTDRTFPITH